MTTAEPPAATLRRAAAKLRRLADVIEPDAVFLRGVPWHTEVDFETGAATAVLQGGAKPADYVQPVWRVAQAETPEVAAYIAAMHPGVALALAAMLDQAADALTGVDVPEGEPALAIAGQILGEA